MSRIADWRRGRESNPRIAVLQTATLPLGYPAVASCETIKRADAVNLRRVSLTSYSYS
jgi:hypothetical protein